MTADDVARLADQAGITPWVKIERTAPSKYSETDTGMDGDFACLVQFAELVAAAERERCAKICDAIERRKWEVLRDGGQMSGVGAKDCAAMIRFTK